MRKLILQMQMSVDGYVSPANGNLDWQAWGWGDRWAWDDRLKAYFNTVFEGVDTILLSRKIVEEGYLDHWGRTAKNHRGNPQFAFAQKVVDAQKVVLTDKLKASRWERTVIARGGLVEEVNALKREEGKDILVIGGVGFASSLVTEGLVDAAHCSSRGAALKDKALPDTSAYLISPDRDLKCPKRTQPGHTMDSSSTQEGVQMIRNSKSMAVAAAALAMCMAAGSAFAQDRRFDGRPGGDGA
jgi:dihydrofolate reductase